MSKVVISRDWVSTIEVLKDNHCDFGTALDNFLKKNIKNGKYKLDYSLMNVEKFSRAYLNGFEVEMSPQDLVEEKYNKIKEDMSNTVFLVSPSPINHAIGFMDGIEYVNKTLNLGLDLK